MFRSSPTRNSRGDHLETAIVDFALLQCASDAPALPPAPTEADALAEPPFLVIRPPLRRHAWRAGFSRGRPEGRRFVRPVPSGRRVPPSWFLSTLTACSARQPQVYCNLVPAMGFAAFPPFANPDQDESWTLAPRTASPQRGSTPRRIPLVSSRTASLRPLPSCGYCLFRIRRCRLRRDRSHAASPTMTEAERSTPRQGGAAFLPPVAAAPGRNQAPRSRKILRTTSNRRTDSRAA